MESELAFTEGLSLTALSAYRGRIQALRAAPQEEALVALKSFEFRRRGHRRHVIRVTDEWDLQVFFDHAKGTRIAVVEALVQRRTNTERVS